MRNPFKAFTLTACLLAAASPALAFDGPGVVDGSFLYLTDQTDGMTLKLEVMPMVCGHADLAPLQSVIKSARKHIVAWGPRPGGINGNCVDICVTTRKNPNGACTMLYTHGWQ